MQSPDVYYTLTPERTFVYADFLHRIGALKNKAVSWKDYFFDDLYSQSGS